MNRFKAYRAGRSIKLEDKGSFIMELEKFEDGEALEVTLREWSDQRSLKQNALMWQWNKEYGEFHGYRPKEMHEVLLYAYAPMQIIQDLNGNILKYAQRSSSMTVKEMCEYLNALDQHGAEHDIPRTIPEDKDKLVNY